MGKGAFALIAALMLEGCERAETVAAGPLAKRPETLRPAHDHYVNRKWGYSIEVPHRWRERATEASADGTVFEGGPADLRVRGSENADDGDFRAAVAALIASSTHVEGGPAGGEYRAVGEGDEGFRTHLRLMRNPDGALVSAAVTYPMHARGDFERAAAAALDTLTVS